jgi:hypothetical protein
MQMGEVCRCRGDLDQAAELLRESITRAEQLQMRVTQAFAHSALGAAAYQADDPGRALIAFERADALFRLDEHPEGIALNHRRRAVAVRARLEEGAAVEPADLRSLIATARERYAALCSPAGMTACDIEDGRLDLLRNAGPHDAVEALNRRLDNTDHRGLLERDPWVPQVLARFAEQVEDEQLVERASRLTAAAVERRAASRERALEVVEPTSAQVATLAVVTHLAATPADDMGGETRRDRDRALAPAA